MVGTRSAVWLTTLFALGVALLVASALPGAASIEERGGGLVAPLSSAIEGATRPFADVVRRAGQIEELSEENAVLRQQVARLEAELEAAKKE